MALLCRIAWSGNKRAREKGQTPRSRVCCSDPSCLDRSWQSTASCLLSSSTPLLKQWTTNDGSPSIARFRTVVDFFHHQRLYLCLKNCIYFLLNCRIFLINYAHELGKKNYILKAVLRRVPPRVLQLAAFIDVVLDLTIVVLMTKREKEIGASWY